MKIIHRALIIVSFIKLILVSTMEANRQLPGASGLMKSPEFLFRKRHSVLQVVNFFFTSLAIEISCNYISN